MDEMMNFPDDWHDFIKSNSFVDREEIYTNGARLMTELRVEQLIEHILREQEPQWVSVKDRLPETRHAVLVYTPHHKNIWAASMHEDGNWYIWTPGGRALLDPDWYGPITYWMPLPEPPKKGA